MSVWFLIPFLLMFISVVAFAFQTTKARQEAAKWKARYDEADAGRNMLMDELIATGDWVDDVLAFHNRFGHLAQCMPHGVPKDIEDLRQKLILEEYQELQHAIEQQHLANIADGCADLIYVVIGTAICFGIDLRPIWQAVQSSNMAKIPYDEGYAQHLRALGKKVPIGKVLKPEGWTPPDIHTLLLRQMPMVGGTFSGTVSRDFEQKTLSDNEIPPKTGVRIPKTVQDLEFFGGRDETTDKQPYNTPNN